MKNYISLQSILSAADKDDVSYIHYKKVVIELVENCLSEEDKIKFYKNTRMRI